ncbi:MAG TPA: hypothetical protein VIS99_00575 [Terrimicrobiaceae bacterium]
MRRYRFNHGNEDPDLKPFNSVTHLLGSDEAIGSDTGVDSTNSVAGFVTVEVNSGLEFEVEIEVALGGRRRKQRLIIRPDTTVPFLISERASHQEGSAELADTAVALQGVITAGHRFSLSDWFGTVFDPQRTFPTRGLAGAATGTTKTVVQSSALYSPWAYGAVIVVGLVVVQKGIKQLKLARAS